MILQQAIKIQILYCILVLRSCLTRTFRGARIWSPIEMGRDQS